MTQAAIEGDLVLQGTQRRPEPCPDLVLLIGAQRGQPVRVADPAPEADHVRVVHFVQNASARGAGKLGRHSGRTLRLRVPFERDVGLLLEQR